jgi:hypothetical protein
LEGAGLKTEGSNAVAINEKESGIRKLIFTG